MQNTGRSEFIRDDALFMHQHQSRLKPLLHKQQDIYSVYQSSNKDIPHP
jgi:hypothetical protein